MHSSKSSGWVFTKLRFFTMHTNRTNVCENPQSMHTRTHRRLEKIYKGDGRDINELAAYIQAQWHNSSSSTSSTTISLPLFTITNEHINSLTLSLSQITLCTVEIAKKFNSHIIRHVVHTICTQLKPRIEFFRIEAYEVNAKEINEKSQNETEMKRITIPFTRKAHKTSKSTWFTLSLSLHIFIESGCWCNCVKSVFTSIFNAGAIAIYLCENPFSYDVHTYAPKRQRQ